MLKEIFLDIFLAYESSKIYYEHISWVLWDLYAIWGVYAINWQRGICEEAEV